MALVADSCAVMSGPSCGEIDLLDATDRLRLLLLVTYVIDSLLFVLSSGDAIFTEEQPIAVPYRPLISPDFNFGAGA